MGRPAGWLKELTGRSAMISPGAPKTRRSIERRFWKEIAMGRSSEEAAGKVGVSAAVGARWFRQGGGMRTIELTEPGGRYLSFSEREEIAVLHAQQVGVREIARRINRDPATIWVCPLAWWQSRGGVELLVGDEGSSRDLPNRPRNRDPR